MDKVAIISLDGLNADQFERILLSMPNFAALTRSTSVMELHSAPFTESNPIWAEILTGKPWYQNGCTGYAKPTTSLKSTQIFTEQNLLIRSPLLRSPSKEQVHILVNTPITSPVEGERIWLAPAGAPFLNSVMPQSLTIEEPFKSYRATPLTSMASAMANTKLALWNFIAAETNRMECVLSLLKTYPWQVLIYRATIFDHLAHLLGPSFLSETDLQVTPQIEKLLESLDDLLCKIFSRAEALVVLSAFSHDNCRFVYSLNDLFASRGLLKRFQTKSDVIERREAFSAIRGETSSPQVSETVLIDPTQTVCSSPTRGTVYLNLEDTFEDGTVTRDETSHFNEYIHSLLSTELSKLGTVEISKNPCPKPGLPHFIVNVEGAEFVESASNTQLLEDLPLSTHHPNGFIYLANSTAACNFAPIRPFQLLDIINNSSSSRHESTFRRKSS